MACTSGWERHWSMQSGFRRSSPSKRLTKPLVPRTLQSQTREKRQESMSNIETVLRQINREIVPQFEERLRSHLASQDREWLIEQLIRLTLDAHSLEEQDR